MGFNFSEAIAEFVVNAISRSHKCEREAVISAFEDTMSVALAGWHESVSQAVCPVYGGAAVGLIAGEGVRKV